MNLVCQESQQICSRQIWLKHREKSIFAFISHPVPPGLTEPGLSSLPPNTLSLSVSLSSSSSHRCLLPAQPIRAKWAEPLVSVGQSLLKRKRCFPERLGVALLCAKLTVLGLGSEWWLQHGQLKSSFSILAHTHWKVQKERERDSGCQKSTVASAVFWLGRSRIMLKEEISFIWIYLPDCNLMWSYLFWKITHCTTGSELHLSCLKKKKKLICWDFAFGKNWC